MCHVWTPTETEQTRLAFETVRHVLEEVENVLDDMVRTRLLVTDTDATRGIAKAHGEVFRDARPASTMIEVEALIEPGIDIRIEAGMVVGCGETSQ